MGEQKEGGKDEGDKKAAAPAADKKDDGKITAVYKIEMHCEGCAKKIKKAVRNFEGIYIYTLENPIIYCRSFELYRSNST